MSAWAGKYVIGLTGNIATGKSVVRGMLEKLGAFGIDADQMAHQVLAKGTNGYSAVIEAFGEQILNKGGEIDRSILGDIVFPDAQALKRLETIVHPIVGQLIDQQVRSTQSDRIVIEAIKLIESQLNKLCDSLWVTYSPEEIQLARLINERQMSETVAKQRIMAQPPQAEKIALADIVIRNDSNLQHLWQQVETAWRQLGTLVAISSAGN